jgi:type II secretory pathway pseudopilin PulG
LAIGKFSNWEIESRRFQITQLLNFPITQYFAMKFSPHIRRSPRHGEQGYIMLILLLAIALMSILAAKIVSDLKFDMRRDREEEMIHRGVQYSRAIRLYYKKFGRYPVKLEDLESTNNLRFLRQRYKDPLNCKAGKCADFKLLHFGEVQMTLSGISGGTIPGASPIGGNGSNGINGPGGLSQSSTFGSSSSFGGNSNSAFGQNQAGAGNQPAGSDSSQAGSSAPSGAGSTDGSGTNSSGSGSGTPGSSPTGSGQIIGGPIVGVASNTPIKDPTIREFNHKTKYKDWVFVYDPAQDQGRLITTPYQPQLQAFGQGTPNLNGNGQNGSGGNTGSAFGTSSGNGFGNSNGSSFGNNNSSGFGNNSNSSSSPGFGSPTPPSNPPPPPQQ